MCFSRLESKAKNCYRGAKLATCCHLLYYRVIIVIVSGYFLHGLVLVFSGSKFMTDLLFFCSFKVDLVVLEAMATRTVDLLVSDDLDKKKSYCDFTIFYL